MRQAKCIICKKDALPGRRYCKKHWTVTCKVCGAPVGDRRNRTRLCEGHRYGDRDAGGPRVYSMIKIQTATTEQTARIVNEILRLEASMAPVNRSAIEATFRIYGVVDPWEVVVEGVRK